MVKATRLTPLQKELLAQLRFFECAVVNTGKQGDWAEPTAALEGEPDAFIWVQATIDSMIDRELVEGLELLALLAYVDWSLWKQYIRELWPRRPFRWEEAYAVRPAIVGVDLSRSEYDWRDEVYGIVASANPDAGGSFHYKRAKQFLLNELAKQGKTPTEMPVRISFNGGKRSKEAPKLLQVLKTQHELSLKPVEDASAAGQASMLHYVGLRVRSVKMNDYLQPTSIDKDLSRLQHTAEAVAAGATVNNLIPPTIKIVEQEPLAFIDAMGKLFPGDEAATRGVSHGVSHASLGTHADTEAMPAVLTAISASSCVRSVDFAPQFRSLNTKKISATDQQLQQRGVWTQFAYGLFVKSPGSQGHHVQHVRIDARTMDQLSIDAITSVLRASNPVAVLFGGTGNEGAIETVSARCFTLLDTKKFGASQGKSTWSSPTLMSSLPVISRTDEWVSVLLPRWGQAWVRQDDVVEAHKAESTSFQVHSVPHMTLSNARTDSSSPHLPLLRLIGKRLRSLTIEPIRTDAIFGSGQAYANNFSRQIFEACPFLEKLEIRCVTKAQLSKTQQLFRDCGGQRIAVRFDPRSKFAFLSVVASGQASPDDVRAIQKLDASSASTILQFAAPSVVRLVICSAA